jgi:hypothetical protein
VWGGEGYGTNGRRRGALDIPLMYYFSMGFLHSMEEKKSPMRIRIHETSPTIYAIFDFLFNKISDQMIDFLVNKPALSSVISTFTLYMY